MSVTLISDTFTDADNTTLASHTMDVGSGWTANTGTFKIVSNKATPSSNANGDTATCDAGQANYILTCDVTPFNNTNLNEDTPGIFIRFQDTSNWYVVQSQSTSTGLCEIYENKAGVVSLKATSTAGFQSGVSYAHKIVVSGSSITVYVNGTLQVAYTSATDFTTATKMGLRVGVGGLPLGLCTFDNFLVQQPTGTATGAATVTGVGAAQFTGIGASVGAAVIAGIGASIFAGVGASTGAAVIAGVGASIAAAAGSAAGSAVVGGVGASINGDNVIAAAVGSASVSGVGASIAAAAAAAAGSTIIAGVGASLVAAAGAAVGAAIVGAVGVAFRRGTADPYRPARPDEGDGFRGRTDEGSSLARIRPDEAVSYRKRTDEAT